MQVTIQSAEAIKSKTISTLRLTKSFVKGKELTDEALGDLVAKSMGHENWSSLVEAINAAPNKYIEADFQYTALMKNLLAFLSEK